MPVLHPIVHSTGPSRPDTCCATARRHRSSPTPTDAELRPGAAERVRAPASPVTVQSIGLHLSRIPGTGKFPRLYQLSRSAKVAGKSRGRFVTFSFHSDGAFGGSVSSARDNRYQKNPGSVDCRNARAGRTMPAVLPHAAIRGRTRAYRLSLGLAANSEQVPVRKGRRLLRRAPWFGIVARPPMIATWRF